jgi:hypothetical protein
LKKLPARYNSVALPFVLSLLMSCIVSGIATLRIIGFAPDFVANWMSAWGWSWIVAFPAILVVLPIARRIVGMVVAPPGRG